jgi:hypothetical protein
MKRAVALSFALAVLSGASAFAQSTVVTTGTAPTVTIEPQYRTRIQSYVTEHRPPAVVAKERFVVGATVPADIELRPVPEDWGPGLNRYRYVYSNDHVVLIEPSSRKVVQIVE